MVILEKSFHIESKLTMKKYVSLYLPWAPEVFRQSLLGHSSLYYHIARVWFPYKAMAL